MSAAPCTASISRRCGSRWRSSCSRAATASAIRRPTCSRDIRRRRLSLDLRQLDRCPRRRRHHGRMRQRQLLPDTARPPRPDGRLPAQGRARSHLRCRRLHAGVFPDVPCPRSSPNWIEQLPPSPSRAAAAAATTARSTPTRVARWLYSSRRPSDSNKGNAPLGDSSQRRASPGVAYCRGSAFAGRLITKTFGLQ